ncbi:MAG: D-alanyl-D-alanine carboxypeptidase [Spirochaetaceae bacterium]|nr:D-alanyl-D-alanine carboxypeptidase [Spirochaetaceae bacterium]
MMKKQTKIILYSSVSFLILLTGIFCIYVHGLKNPETIVLSETQKQDFSKLCNELYPQALIKPLPYPVTPAQLEVNSGSAILIDSKTGCILYEKNADKIIPPASMTKLVVMYVVFQEIATGRISLDDIVPLPPEAWAINAPPQSSLMFLGEGQTVTLKELLLGLAIASGNDAAIAVAHYVSGSVDKFIQRMNYEMQKLGLKHTRFVEPSGYSENNLTTPREFAAFARKYIETYPESLELFHSQKSISYPQEHNLAEWHRGQGTEQPIFQSNTNKLLGLLPGCDGLKTGFIFESGYNLSLTAKRNGTRFISVTMEGPGRGTVEGNKYRIIDGTTLMEWAFDCFATRPEEQIDMFQIPVLEGKENSLLIAPAYTEALTVPAIIRGKTPQENAQEVICTIQIPEYFVGPISAGKQIGTVTYSLQGINLMQIPLVAVNSVDQGNFAKRMIDKLAKNFM